MLKTILNWFKPSSSTVSTEAKVDVKPEIVEQPIVPAPEPVINQAPTVVKKPRKPRTKPPGPVNFPTSKNNHGQPNKKR